MLMAWSMEHGAWGRGTEARMAKFRFQDSRIWQAAIEIADQLFDIADDLGQRKLYRFAYQIRGAGMSMSNNIAEGSGSYLKREFGRFLNIARRSTFENANVVLLLERRKLLSKERANKLLDDLELLCRQISSFRSILK
jgi:four helix bundle protein